MDPDVVRRRQELREEAYYLVLKAFMCRDRPDMALLGKLRVELSIGPDIHKQWLRELAQQKNEGTLNKHVDTRPGASLASRPASTVQRQQQHHHQQQHHYQQMQEHNGASAAAKPPSKDDLPADPMYLKVQFYKTAPEAKWWEGVITDYKPEIKKIRVHTLNTKLVEWLDYKPSPLLIVHRGLKVADLQNYI